MKIICSECGRVIDYGIYKTKLKEKVITSYDICKKCKRKLSDGGKND